MYYIPCFVTVFKAQDLENHTLSSGTFSFRRIQALLRPQELALCLFQGSTLLENPQPSCVDLIASIPINRCLSHNILVALQGRSFLSLDRREITELQKSLQEKADEVRQLQKKLVDTNHANHTEIVKIRLEVNAYKEVAPQVTQAL